MFMRFLLAFTTFVFFSFSIAKAQTTDEDQLVETYSRAILTEAGPDAIEAVEKLIDRGKSDVLATIILAMRFRGEHPILLEAASKFAGEPIKDWHEAMLWQEKHPEIVPHHSYADIKMRLMAQIDPNFLRFLSADRSNPEKMDIRLEEIAWGGVIVDGIPSLDDPTLIEASEAEYLLDSDLVFGVAINGDARAYPLRIMGWHEMFNETIGGVPVALAYCTLCGSGILFETQVEGRKRPFVFGSSGFLYRSNKLMFDRETDSLWNQFTGEPVMGPLHGSGIKLKIRPVVITTWANWRESNPNTKVLSLDTGHNRNYDSGIVYKKYFASPDLMFPAIVRDETRLRRKDYVFGIRDVGASKAWPLDVFTDKPVINDSIGTRSIVLIGDAATRTVRAYDREDHEFKLGAPSDTLESNGTSWTIKEDALHGPTGERLSRVSGHIAYWFAWDGYLGAESALYDGS